MAEPIKELITQNLAAVLATVTTGNGYHCTLDVERADPAGVRMEPWAATLFEGDDQEDATHRLAGKTCWVAPYYVFVFAGVVSGVTPGQVLTRLEADLQKAVMADLKRGGYAQNTYWKPPERATNDNGELIGTLCTIHVHYRHNETNPYSL